MELLEANQRYRLFTKNDRGVGTVIYHKQDGEEDIIFRPFFHEEGDPSYFSPFASRSIAQASAVFSTTP